MSNNNDRGIFNVFNEEFRNLQPSQPGETSCTTENVPNDDPFTVSRLSVLARTVVGV